MVAPNANALSHPNALKYLVRNNALMGSGWTIKDALLVSAPVTRWYALRSTAETSAPMEGEEMTVDANCALANPHQDVLRSTVSMNAPQEDSEITVDV